jgi:hypothetical protein
LLCRDDQLIWGGDGETGVIRGERQTTRWRQIDEARLIANFDAGTVLTTSYLGQTRQTASKL